MTVQSKFQRAERKRVKLKIAITGPSGSGKTFSALELATGIAGPEGKIAFIDTENDSASLYSDRFVFDTLNIDPPYTVQKYIEAMKAAEAEKYDVVVIDSLSHAWAGEGGLLAKKEALDSRGGNQNQYTNWGSITKEHETFKASILNSDIHMICTMRSKQDYQQIEENGRKKIQKVGMAPIQRDGMEYEFTTVFDVAMDHAAVPSKDRTGLFDGFIAKLSAETGKTFMQWLGGANVEAKPSPKIEAPQAPVTPPVSGSGGKVTDKQLGRLRAMQTANGVPDEVVKGWIQSFNINSSKELHWKQYNQVIEKIEHYKPEGEAPLSEQEIPF